MFDIAKTPQNSGIPAQGGRYFKLQIRAWTDFDPMDKNLSEITEAIEQGGGLLTAIEVLTVEEDLAAISDNEVREGFQNILAARRVLRSVGELPKKLVEDLRAALKAQEEVAERKPVSSAGSQPAPVFRQA
ncbi:MAG: hypothetical protein DMG88_22800 [Acidobacteria bacterium]|nr:MAG: hypothetical protein DMG88_22800 [Acidobacteriota bacterium]